MAELMKDVNTLGGVAGGRYKQGNQEFIFAYVPASSLAGQPLVLSFTGVVTTNPSAVAPATSSVYQLVVFPTAAQGSTAGFQWCQFRGDATVLVDGTTDVAVSDFLKVANAGTALIKDATSKGTTSIAIAQAARTTNSAGLLAVYLLGERVTI